MTTDKPPATPSRRTVVQWTLAGIAAALPLSRGAAAQETQKITKTEAKYEDRPHGQQRCEICLNFRPPHACVLVAGRIEPKGWCQYFAARENAH